MIRKGKLIVLSLFLFFHFFLEAQPVKGTLLYNWTDPTLESSAQYGNIYNEVWGFEINGNEYAVIGSTEGTHFINVTNPENAKEDFFIQGASHGPHIIHRDYHDFKGYLYAVSDEDTGVDKSSLQIIDLTKLPEEIEVVYDSRDRIRKAHNIFIDSSESRLYACAVKNGDDPYSPLRIYDISDPINPTLLESYKNGIAGVSIGHVHDTYVKNNIAYLNAGFDGLLIVDFSDVSNPIILSHLLGTDYPESGYNHSGWLSQDGNYYYFADETWGTKMKVYDVSDPTNILLVATFDAGNESPFSIPHNQIVSCDYLFTSYYYDGLQVFNIQDPTNPIRILFYPTTTKTPTSSYEGAWGVYPFLPSGNILVSDMQNGLFIIRKFADYCTPSATDEQIVADLKINIFPNPNTGTFKIQSEEKIKRFKLYNITGSLVFESGEFVDHEFQMNHISPGIYFAELNIGTYRIVEKIVIEK